MLDQLPLKTLIVRHTHTHTHTHKTRRKEKFKKLSKHVQKQFINLMSGLLTFQKPCQTNPKSLKILYIRNLPYILSFFSHSIRNVHSRKKFLDILQIN